MGRIRGSCKIIRYTILTIGNNSIEGRNIWGGRELLALESRPYAWRVGGGSEAAGDGRPSVTGGYLTYCPTR